MNKHGIGNMLWFYFFRGQADFFQEKYYTYHSMYDCNELDTIKPTDRTWSSTMIYIPTYLYNNTFW